MDKQQAIREALIQRAPKYKSLTKKKADPAASMKEVTSNL